MEELSILGSRESHNFITTDHTPQGSYAKLNDDDYPENPFGSVELLEEPLPVVVEDDGDYENWTEEEAPEEQLPFPPKRTQSDPVKVQFTKAFRRRRKLRKHSQPNRKETVEFILKARTGYKKVGQRYHSYAGIIGDKQIKQNSHIVQFRDLPEEKEIPKHSKYYRHPAERTNQHPHLRTKAAEEGYNKAILEYVDYITREVINFGNGKYRAAKVRAFTTKQNAEVLKLELVIAHEKGLRNGWYLCEGAEDIPWGNCAEFCRWPGRRGPEPSEKFHRKMEQAYLEDDRKEIMLRPPLKTLDKAHLTFTAGSTARFAYSEEWRVTRRITEIEKYMNLTTVRMLSDPKILKNNMNKHFYADVEAKVHYWGGVHQLNMLMPQRELDDLMEILSRERFKRLVRLHRLRMNQNKEEMKKGIRCKSCRSLSRERRSRWLADASV
ncbi:uncharacterized protein DFL_003225 [Arthrobotrys flagrans]|uniref:Uncharacterized protein n=1 Tax=Arthrobotrys flagrans TaxID=97331 RepID=A0A437A103_ARTFL|nr:hypothetical protein DFL_003225 [Arthrobotrys flagrans]